MSDYHRVVLLAYLSANDNGDVTKFIRIKIVCVQLYLQNSNLS